MSTPQPPPIKRPIEEITLHPQAGQLARTLVADYSALLTRQGQVLAARQAMDQVQRVHIEQARHLLAQDDRKSRVRELCLVFGGRLFGAFVQGFIEALADNKPPLIVIYVIAGFVGVGLIFWALWQR